MTAETAAGPEETIPPALQPDEQPRNLTLSALWTELPERRRVAELALILLAIVAGVYVVGWGAWHTYGLAPGTPEELVHSVFDRWDVLNYILIAEEGYGISNYHVVWFPVLPGIMRLGAYVGIAPWVTGTVLVLMCTTIASGVFYLLVRMDLPANASRDAVIYLLVFPSSLFLFVPYTEALLLLLAVASFYFARRRQWALACACAGLASGVRITGVYLGPALLVKYLASVDWDRRRIRPDIGWLALAPVGLAGYMLYQWITFDDALAFYHAQLDFPRLESIQSQGGLTHFIPSLIDQTRLIFTSHSNNEQWLNALGLAGIVVAVAGFTLMLRYRMRPSYLVFTALAVGMNIFPGRLMSFNRFVVLAFPIFIAIAMTAERWPIVRIPLIVGSVAGLCFSAALFSTYRWAG